MLGQDYKRGEEEGEKKFQHEVAIAAKTGENGKSDF